MIDRVVEQQDAIRIDLSADHTVSHLMFTWQDLDVLSSVSSVLHPLRQMTDLLSGEQYNAVSVVKPLLNHILSKVLFENEEDTTLSKEIKDYNEREVKFLLCERVYSITWCMFILGSPILAVLIYSF